MSFATKHNKEKLFLFEPAEGLEHMNLSDLVEIHGLTDETGAAIVHKIQAVYINTKGKYGDQPVIGNDEAYINVPHHMVETFREILEDAESINLINSGHAGFTIYQYENQHGMQLGLTFADIA